MPKSAPFAHERKELHVVGLRVSVMHGLRLNLFEDFQMKIFKYIHHEFCNVYIFIDIAYKRGSGLSIFYKFCWVI